MNNRWRTIQKLQIKYKIGWYFNLPYVKDKFKYCSYYVGSYVIS